MSDIAKIVGERIRNYRLQEGYSQEALAERANLHPTYIGQLERGEKNATLESVEKVTNALGLSMAQLFEFIPPSNETQSVAGKCYRIVQSQPVEKQNLLLDIISKIIIYKDL